MFLKLKSSFAFFNCKFKIYNYLIFIFSDATTLNAVPRIKVIEAIANAIASTDGCNLLDVDPGASTNRTVYTFVGSPEAVVEGALNSARVASHVIDMSRHHGEHPRMGAMDVCPFVPVRNTTMEDCVQCAKQFAMRLATELSLPSYLYGAAATEDYRKTLPQVRAGEYEGLEEKLSKPEWRPDFGPCDFVPSWGATSVGARKFLIAYNVNMLSTKEQAHRVALNIREQGRGSEEPGKLKNCQAIGWYLEEANIAQVSINLTDHEVTPIHAAYEEAKKDADDLNLAVVGSQIVGLVPLKALMQAADFYMEREKLFILEEDQKLRLVVNRLGLSSISAFNPKERIIEYMIDDNTDGPLVSMDVKDFIQSIGSRSSAPGGGSVSALLGALGAALGAMVGFLTYGNRKFEELDEKMRVLIPPLYKGMKDLTPFIDADAAAFSEYMLALKMPHKTEEETELRVQAQQQGLKTAVQVPLTVAKIITSLWLTVKQLAQVGNINCKSDLQVGVRTMETAVWGTYYNIMINLDSITDEEYKAKVKEQIDGFVSNAQENCAAVLKILEGRKV